MGSVEFEVVDGLINPTLNPQADWPRPGFYRSWKLPAAEERFTRPVGGMHPGETPEPLAGCTLTVLRC